MIGTYREILLVSAASDEPVDADDLFLPYTVAAGLRLHVVLRVPIRIVYYYLSFVIVS